MKRKKLSECVDELMELFDLQKAVLVYVKKDGSPGIVSRSDSEVDSAHLLMAAAEVLHEAETVN